MIGKRICILSVGYSYYLQVYKYELTISLLSFSRAEPWLQGNISSHFYYGRARQRAVLGRGSNLKRRLGLRLIVDHPSSKGWFEMLPILFVSVAAMANFVSSNPTEIGSTTMVSLTSLDSDIWK